MSAYEDSFSLNSVDYGGASYKLHVVSGLMPICPEWRVNLHNLAQADGAVSQGSTSGPRFWNLRCVVAGASKAEMITLVNNVQAALDAAHTAGETAFVMGWQSSRTYQARPMGRLDAELAITGAEFDLQIVAPKPDYT